jgi:hypothetical protein
VRFPVFVVGMPRSGTTLVSALLDAHPDLAILPETHFYTRCRREETGETAAAVWDRLQQQPGFQDAAFTAEEKEQIRSRVPPGGAPADLLRAVGTAYAERAGASAWGEKTPDHLAHLDRMRTEFPDGVYLGIVRDARDVCLSLQGLPWNRDTVMESAWTWRRYQEMLRDHRKQAPERVRIIRYEDLLAQPRETLRSILTWLEAPASADRIDRMLAFHAGESGPADPDREPWKQKTRRPIDPSNREKWRTQMSPARRWMVQAITGATLTGFGYPVPAVDKNAAFWADLVDVAVESVRCLVQRWRQRLSAASRPPDDAAPVWMRPERNE